jgi:hypothetical protein
MWFVLWAGPAQAFDLGLFGCLTRQDAGNIRLNNV